MKRLKMKENYYPPMTDLTRVELESPICGGSVDITAQSPAGVSTDAQEVNQEFGNANDFSGSTSWDGGSQG